MVFSIRGEEPPGSESISAHLRVDLQVVMGLGRLGHGQMRCPVTTIDIGRFMHDALDGFVGEVLGLLKQLVVDSPSQSYFLGGVGATASGEPECLEAHGSLAIIPEEGGCLPGQGLSSGHLGYSGRGLDVAQ